jgi:aspartyl/glutamyl-tRNA(Asn/Gln) amidotransferase C subunit
VKAEKETEKETTKGRPAEQIDDKTIDAVADLAQLALLAQEKEAAKQALLQELGFIRRLEELPPEDSGDAFFASAASQPVLRADEITQDCPADAILQNAPCLSDRYYPVPRTIGESS